MRGNREYDGHLTWHFADETGAPSTSTINVQRMYNVCILMLCAWELFLFHVKRCSASVEHTLYRVEGILLKPARREWRKCEHEEISARAARGMRGRWIRAHARTEREILAESRGGIPGVQRAAHSRQVFFVSELAKFKEISKKSHKLWGPVRALAQRNKWRRWHTWRETTRT